MIHIGKYFGYIFHGAGRILFYPRQAKKYLKHKEDYPLKERYAFVRTKAIDVLDNILRVELNVEGLDYINNDDTYLFVPNHQGMLDPVTILKLIKKPTVFVSKKEIEKTPIIGKIEKVIDAIFLDRDSPRDALAMSKTCKQYLLDNTNVVIFAEGTRSKDEEKNIGTYKPGAFKCAYGTGAKVVPIVIDKSYVPLSTKIKNTDKVIKIRFLKPIESHEYEKLTTAELAIMVENMAKDELIEMRK